MIGTVSASLEDYLEAIFHIAAAKQAARPKDIAERLRVNNSSVTGALKLLSEKGLVNYAPYDLVTLTGAGRSVAEDVIRRHEALRDFFANVLAVSRAEAEDAACKMEHCVTRNILDRFIDFTAFVAVCPRGGAKWIAGFRYYREHGGQLEDCERCLADCLAEVKGRHPGEKGKSRMTQSLKELKPGQKGRIIKVRARGAINKRLAEMGMTPGTLLEVERVAPLGDPLEIKVKGYHLSLRQAEAEGIAVEVL